MSTSYMYPSVFLAAVYLRDSDWDDHKRAEITRTRVGTHLADAVAGRWTLFDDDLFVSDWQTVTYFASLSTTTRRDAHITSHHSINRQAKVLL